MNYHNLVRDLAKPGKTILQELSSDDCHLLHMLCLLSSEVGELTDCLKKTIIYNKPLDIENLVEEFGDIEFALEGLRQGLGISRDAVLQANIDKLRKRYGATYSDQSAQERKDKQI